MKKYIYRFWLLLLLLPFILPSKAGASVPVTVSLEFDDGTISQKIAADILQKYGLSGTFYVSSSRIGQEGFLARETLLQMQSAGHEIGGHTVNHVDLGLLTEAGRTAEIVDDKRALELMGFKISTLSYPFGSYNQSIMTITKASGYRSGRTVGGIGYGSMRPAESLPPQLQYATETLPSVKGWDTLDTLKGYVNKAESSGGGWLQFVFHKINTTGETYSISPQTLAAFTCWLKTRGVAVKTVEQALNGTAPSPTPTPLPPPEPTPDPAPTPIPGNIIINSSFESDDNNDGIPDYWDLVGWGTTTYRYQRVAPGYGGGWAERVEIFTSGGERKIVTTQKDLTKAPIVLPGRKYTLSLWYKSSVPTRLVVYYRANKMWNWFGESVYFSPTEVWQKAEWTVTLPSNAEKVSVGALIKKIGWLTIDEVEFSLVN